MNRTSTQKRPNSSSAKEVESDLRAHANAEKAAFYPRFFKTGKGEYGEGDQFIGVVVPEQRKVARRHRELARQQIKKLLASRWHECRLTGLLILVGQFERTQDAEEQKSIYDFYLANLERVNNWDLVDASCHKIMGPYLFERSRRPLLRFARSKDLWENRIAIVTTYYFIKRDDLGTTIDVAEILVQHEHDLIHKAVGWMLRELGKKDEALMLSFLERHIEIMPRTMLRYSIEKLPKSRRQRIMSGQF